MAIRLNGSAAVYRTANLLNLDANYAISFWLYVIARPGTENYSVLWQQNPGAGNSIDSYNILKIDASTAYFNIYTLSAAGGFAESTASTNITLNTWYHIGIIRSANNSRIMYVNGSAHVTHTANLSGRTASTEMDMGVTVVNPGDYLDGRIAHIKIWQATLTAAQIAAEAYSIRPLEFTGLNQWHPTFAGATERISDYSGNGRNWTASGTLSDEDGPPVAWSPPIVIMPFPATGGGGALEGTLSATLGDITSAATGTLAITGTAAPTLGALTLAATGGAGNTGTLAGTLGSITVTAAGTLAITGTAAPTLGNITLSAQGYLLINACVGGLLEVDSSNARYLRNTAGRLVLAGFHTWGNVQDAGGSYPPSAFDWDEYLDALVAKGNNFTKLWALETGRGWPSDDDQWFYPPRYVRTGPGNDNDGRLKFDLTRINPDYLARLRTRAIEAGNAGIYVCVQLFNAWHISNKGLTYNPWTYHPYELANNINSVDGDQDNDGQGYDVNAVSGNVALSYQKALIEAMIDATADLDNVIYEICNESTGGARATAAQAWQEELLDHTQTYLAGIGRANLVGVTVMYPSGSNTWLDGTDAAWVSYNADKADLVHAATDPPSMYDTDHTTGGDDTHAWIFTAFCEGHGGLWLMDLWDSGAGGAGDMRADANYEVARRCLGDVIAYAARIDLANATPQGSLASTGYCLAKTTGRQQLIAYQPTSGNFTVDLTGMAGTFSVEFLRTSTGATSTTTVAGGAVRTLTAPWAGEDFVAFLELSAISGAASVTLASITATGAGTSGTTGAAAIALAAVTATAAATVAVHGSGAGTLASITTVATAAVAISGAGAATLDAITLTATTSTSRTGSLAATLDGLTAVAAGAVAIAGQITAALADLAPATTGTVAITGSAAGTLEAVTLAGTAVIGAITTGQLAATLDSLTATATGTVAIVGQSTPALDGLTLTAAGALPVAGQAAVTLADITVFATTSAVTFGAAAVTLAPLTATATGMVGLIIAVVTGTVRGPAASGTVRGVKARGTVKG